MLPAWLVTKFGPVVARLIVAGVIIALAVGLYFAVRSYFTAGLETQVKVGSNQLDALGKSANDAVQSIGNTVAADQVGDKITQENGNAIDQAKGSDVGVDPAARAAGMRALCRRESYRRTHATCVQQTTP